VTRRAWIRGVGAVTPLGSTWRETVPRLAAGESAVKPVERFDVTGYPCQVAAEVRTEFAIPDRRLALALSAAHQALEECGPRQGVTGIFVGAESGRATYQTILALSRAAGGGKLFDHARFGLQARALAASIDATAVSPAAVASVLAGELDAHGPAVTISLACASGSAAIAEGVRALRQGACDVAVCVGVGADVDPFMLAGFGLLGALSGRGISCPFDARRDGFVVGEGAAAVVLSVERGESTVEIAGIGRSLDAHHLTAPEPEGDGAVRAMRAALAEARRDRVGYVQAHGTSTPLNDAVEALALRRVFGDGLAELRVASVKGALGHWVAGAGAIGFLCAHEAVQHGLLLPTANLVEPDPRCDLPHVAGTAVRADCEAALVSSFAFGGANASLVLARAS
jgi:3-oxoacyl-(acyl-carrier-protein) synthase